VSQVTEARTQIECRCGAVGVELRGEPLLQFYCHCDDCQAVHGAAFVPVAMYKTDAVSIVRGEASSWSLRTTPRRTCPACGTRLFAEPNPRVRGVTAYLLPAGLFKPTFHIQCRFAVLPVRDDLPHYRSLPARLGGADETVDW
jgi:hypothetical protein